MGGDGPKQSPTELLLVSQDSDGHPHSCSTDFEQTLPGRLATRWGVGCWVSTSPSAYMTALGVAVCNVERRGRVQSPSDVGRKVQTSKAKFAIVGKLLATANSIPPCLRTTVNTPLTADSFRHHCQLGGEPSELEKAATTLNFRISDARANWKSPKILGKQSALRFFEDWTKAKKNRLDHIALLFF